jgi:iron complex outermembrane receptor protein
MSHLRVLAVSLCSTAGLLASNARADDSAPAGDSLAEVIVTAEKRSERLIDVPMSITAATGEQLASLGITTPADLEKIVPGFTYQMSTYGVPIYTIRGIGFYDISLANPPTVTTYLDQVPLPYSVMTEGVTFDVERVEVLKGPQGTLFGQNSTGGAINYIANKPTKTLDLGADVTYGRFNEVDADGYISGPLFNSGNVRARLAVRSEHRDDWQYSSTRNDSNGERDFLTGRFLLDWDISDAARIELGFNGWQDKSDTQAAQFIGYAPVNVPGRPEQALILPTVPISPSNPRAADWNADYSLARDDSFLQGSLRADIDLGDLATLTSISAYSHYRAHSPSDTDGTAFDDFAITLSGSTTSVSEELRLAGSALDKRLLWMAGGNYEHDRALENSYAQAMGSEDQVGPYEFNDAYLENDQFINTYAAFGSLDWGFTDSLRLQASVRYTERDDTFQGCLFDAGDGQFSRVFSFITGQTVPPGHCLTVDTATGLIPPIVRSELDQNNVSWRAGLNWKPDTDTLLYANVTRGYKAGDFPTLPALSVNGFQPAVQESVLSTEIGFKSNLVDRRVELEGSAFYYDYTNKQIFGWIYTGPPFGRTEGLINVPKSSVKGAELDVRWHPVKALTLSLNSTFVDSRVSGSFITSDQFNNDVNVGGEAFPNTPRWQGAGDAQYDFPLSGAAHGFFGANVSYRTSSFAAFGENRQFNLPGRALLDLRAGVMSEDGRWRVELWGRNVTDKYYWVQVSHVQDTVDRVTGMPATFGVTLGYRFR